MRTLSQLGHDGQVFDSSGPMTATGRSVVNRLEKSSRNEAWDDSVSFTNNPIEGPPALSTADSTASCTPLKTSLANDESLPDSGNTAATRTGWI